MTLRIFQNYGLYPSYKKQLAALRAGLSSFNDLHAALIADRYSASHLLLPCLEREPATFLTASDDDAMQRAWAAEHGMTRNTSLDDILLAQIEDHRTEIFYNLSPMTHGNAFLKRLPGTVRKTVAWRAAPSAGGDFEDHDVLLSNVTPMIEQYRAKGMRVEYFSPAHDPVMDRFAANEDRPVDVAFVGTYSRHHMRRAAIIETLAELGTTHSVALYLNSARSTRLADTVFGLIGPLRKFRRPRRVREVSSDPVFGRQLYTALGRSRIIVNGAIDMAGDDRANMRCWEAMGAAALMIGEAGNYPPHMIPGQHFVAFRDVEELPGLIDYYLARPDEANEIAQRGYAMIKSCYSKSRQWSDFERIVGKITA